MTGKRKRGAQPGSQHALKHGGEAAVAAIRHGRVFTGILAEAELAVYRELDEGGVPALVRRLAARAVAATDLYWNALSAAAEDRNLDAIDGYVGRFGWLLGVSMRALEQMNKHAAAANPMAAYDAAMIELEAELAEAAAAAEEE